jgi:four helix bundle protein
MSRNFEELEVWKRACRLAVEIYKALADSREYSLKDQMTRAAVSVASNIAEGAERATQKEYLRFLDIAKGSAGELRTQLYIIVKLHIINEVEAQKLIEETRVISKMLQALQNALRKG